jgi:RNA polymerase sigma-70 factor (ECF subfamily)
VQDTGKLARFDQAVVPHLDAAYNLARWLMRNKQDAEDMVQEACLRAFTFFHSFQGEDGRAWLLAIVRNTCYTWLKKNRARELDTVFEEQIHSVEADAANPEVLLVEKADRELLQQLLEQLPTEFREVLILRELEGMSYKQISAIADLPIGTVMSRLARARKRLEQQLAMRTKQES